MKQEKTCNDCKHFPENKNYAFCSMANHSGRLEVMSYWAVCDKFEEGKHIPLFTKD